MHISDIYLNPKNPRTIKEADFLALVRSLRTFPHMLEIRPVALNEKSEVMGGNMRYRAIDYIIENPPGVDDKEDAIWKGVRKTKNVPGAWIKQVKDFTPEQWDEFVIKDNIPAGQWDYEALGNEWDTAKLLDWGLHLPNFSAEDHKAAQSSYDNAQGDTSEDEGMDSDADSSHVRMVQLFFNEGNIDMFRAMEERLRKHYGTENTTDTVYAAIKERYEEEIMIESRHQSNEQNAE